MKLLKDERVVALNDVITLSLDAARLYLELAAVAEGPTLAEELRALADRRRAAAARLSTEVRRLGELPAAPPQEERVLLESAAARLLAGLAAERDAALRAEVRAKEAALGEAAGRLVALDLSADALSAARSLVEETRA